MNGADDASAGPDPVAASSQAAFPAPLDEASRAATWTEAWAALGRPAPAALRQELEAAWAEPQRHCHDTRHLGECLALWSHWQAQAEHPAEVAIALWFHDAVYEPQASGNELKSAAWAARSLLGAGLSSAVAQRVYDLVMATRHDAAAQGVDAELLVDIDLAILGSPSERFEAYDQDVRKEYAWVPGYRYRSGRVHVLQGFLDRPRLYQGASAVALFEQQARTNLAAALSRLAQ
jgi:predicted metal-dependent HD superfamily phosphohydrolase